MSDVSVQRNQRNARLLADASPDELRQTALQAIDHAYHTSGEVAQAYALFEGAKGTIAQLTDENLKLRVELKEYEELLESIYESKRWRLAAAFAAPLVVLRRGRR